MEPQPKSIDPVILLNVGETAWNLKSCQKAQKSFFVAFFDDRSSADGENRGTCRLCEKKKELKVRDSYNVFARHIENTHQKNPVSSLLFSIDNSRNRESF